MLSFISPLVTIVTRPCAAALSANESPAAPEPMTRKSVYIVLSGFKTAKVKKIIGNIPAACRGNGI